MVSHTQETNASGEHEREEGLFFRARRPPLRIRISLVEVANGWATVKSMNLSKIIVGAQGNGCCINDSCKIALL